MSLERIQPGLSALRTPPAASADAFDASRPSRARRSDNRALVLPPPPRFFPSSSLEIPEQGARHPHEATA